MRRLKYAVTGGLVGLGAPEGLLAVRLLRHGLQRGSLIRDVQADLETFVYVAVSTVVVFALFGGVLGHFGDRLAHLAQTDALTGLFNSRAFQERLHHEVLRAARYQEPLSLLVIDVDRLKRVNDQHGHQAGDAALRAVATAIRGRLRGIDLGARLGGDEFAVVLPQTDEASATVAGERLRALLAPVAGRPERVTISVGVASLIPAQNRSVSAASLLAAADRALYAAKGRGGNRVQHATAGQRISSFVGRREAT